MIFTDKQIQDLATQLNEQVDIPFVSESMEQSLIKESLKIIGGSLSLIIPPPLLLLLNAVPFNESLMESQTASFVDRLTAKANKAIDIPFMDEETEAKLIRQVIEFIVECMASTKSLDEKIEDM